MLPRTPIELRILLILVEPRASKLTVGEFTQYFFLVIPTTTKPKKGTWYVQINHGGTDMFVCLHQARAVDYRRFHSKMGSINPVDRDRIRLGLIKLLG